MARSPFYDWGGWWPAKTHGWTSTMIEYDGRHGTPFGFEYGYSQGYQVNIQLRPGERLTRNWFHNGLHVNDGNRDGVLEIGMPTSYVYLTGKLELRTQVSDGGSIRVQLSDNNGLDWKDVTSVDKSGEESIDLQSLVLRRYDYRLRLVISGANMGIDHLKITHDVQCSQRALPTLGQGANTIFFSAGPHEGTVTVQGSSIGHGEGKQVQPFDFRPEYDGVKPQYLRDERYGGKTGSVTFPIATPGEMTRLRFGMHYRCRGLHDQWEMQVSLDGGKTFKTVEIVTGPTQGGCRYVTVGDVPSACRRISPREDNLPMAGRRPSARACPHCPLAERIVPDRLRHKAGNDERRVGIGRFTDAERRDDAMMLYTLAHTHSLFPGYSHHRDYLV